MAKKHKPEEVVAKLRQVDVLISQGAPIADAIRSIGVTEVTYYRWRNEYGGLKSDQVKRRKDTRRTATCSTMNVRPKLGSLYALL
jgi:transposase-like protein